MTKGSILLGIPVELVGHVRLPTFLEYEDIQGRVEAPPSDLARYLQHVPTQLSSPPWGGTKNDQ